MGGHSSPAAIAGISSNIPRYDHLSPKPDSRKLATEPVVQTTSKVPKYDEYSLKPGSKKLATGPLVRMTHGEKSARPTDREVPLIALSMVLLEYWGTAGLFRLRYID